MNVRRSPFAIPVALIFLTSGVIYAQSNRPENEAGIPISDPLVIAKCGSCHPRDVNGNIERVSWQRTTPEGWQDEIKQMILRQGLSVTPAEARSLVRTLSRDLGLSPDEAQPVMYDPERRIREETTIPSEQMRECARCHAFARALEWRRSAEEWKQFALRHSKRYQTRSTDEAVAFLTRAAPLRTPEWTAWSARNAAGDVSGDWLVTAHIPGRGDYYGNLHIGRAADGEFATKVELRQVRDGSVLTRTGRGALFNGYAWRGRSSGDTHRAGPDAETSDAREVMWFAPDQLHAEGRWFWGQYQEFEINVKLARPRSETQILLLDRTYVKIGTQANRIRIIGDRFPEDVTVADFDFGQGVTARRIVAHTVNDVALEADVAPEAQPGKRDVRFRASILPRAIAVYDRIDYVDVVPSSAVAAFSDATHPKGFLQFEAIAYQRGADGRLHTADDVELGPVDAQWSLQVFHAPEKAKADLVGSMSAGGLLTPSDNNPNLNFDCWVTAVTNERDRDGEPLTGKSYVVVTVPTYVFNRRRYIRDLDRWIDDGPASIQETK